MSLGYCLRPYTVRNTISFFVCYSRPSSMAIMVRYSHAVDYVAYVTLGLCWKVLTCTSRAQGHIQIRFPVPAPELRTCSGIKTFSVGVDKSRLLGVQYWNHRWSFTNVGNVVIVDAIHQRDNLFSTERFLLNMVLLSLLTYNIRTGCTCF